MNSRSEHIALHCVRIPLTFHLSCHAYVCILLLCIHCFLPPLIFGRPRCYRRLHRCRVRLLRRRPYHYRRASRQAEPFSSPDIAYLSALSCTRHCYCCCYDYNPIQLHSLLLSPLDVPSVILCCLLYLCIYS